MKKLLTTAALLTTVGLIAGCGSNDGSMMTSQSSKSVLTGKVADGYLANATVFLDKNSNYQLDAGEPSAMTDANGAYALTVSPADVGKYPIVVLATAGVTIDMDNPTQKITKSYVLSMPKDSVSGTVNSNFISPMSSQLREMMETGKYSNVQQAMADLGTKLGMPVGTNMLQDYMEAKHEGLHTAAQNMANLMGTQMAQVMENNGSTTTVQVDRYRGMMGTIFSNMSSVRGSNPHTPENMKDLASMMTSALGSMKPGQPFRNMSTAFRGGMGMIGR